MVHQKLAMSGLCLAAGASSRMTSGHKLLRKIGERSVIEHTVRQMLALGFEEVLVITGARREEIEDEIRSYPLNIIHNSNFRSGMHSSLRLGVESMADNLGFVVCLADQPFALERRLHELLRLNLNRNDLVRSEFEGKPGHPTFIGSDFKKRILAEEDRDSGAGYLFREFPFQIVTQGKEALWDLDTEEDFNAYAEHSV